MKLNQAKVMSAAQRGVRIFRSRSHKGEVTDLLQEAVLAIYTAAEKASEEPNDFDGWATVLVVRHLRRYINCLYGGFTGTRRFPRQKSMPKVRVDQTLAVDEHLIGAEYRDAIFALDTSKGVGFSVLYDGYKASEIAKKKGIPVANVYRATNNLRRSIRRRAEELRP